MAKKHIISISKIPFFFSPVLNTKTFQTIFLDEKRKRTLSQKEETIEKQAKKKWGGTGKGRINKRIASCKQTRKYVKAKKKENKTKYRGKKEYKTNRKKTCSEPNSRLLIENLRFLQNSVCANLGKQGKHVNLRQIEF